MKKHPLSVLLILTCVFAAFTLGLFLGRNQNHETIYLSQVSRDSRHPALATVSTAPPVTEAAEISFPIDLNTADAQMLTALPGIGEVLAHRILDYREANGPFDRPEELMNVEGIGAGKLEAILDYVTTGG